MPFNYKAYYANKNKKQEPTSNLHKELQAVIIKEPWIHSISELATHVECSRAYVVKAVKDLEESGLVKTWMLGNSIGVLSMIPPENPKRYVQWAIMKMALMFQTSHRHALIKDKNFPSGLSGNIAKLFNNLTNTFNLDQPVEEKKEEISSTPVEEPNPFDELERE